MDTVNASENSEPPRRVGRARTSWLMLVALLVVALGLRDTSRAAVLAGTRESTALAVALGGPTHTLRGRIETGQHAAIPGATVEAILVLEGSTYPVGRAIAGSDGRFALADLPEGSYWLVARAPGRARHVEVLRVLATNPADVTLALGLGATVAGRVTRAGMRGEPDRPLAGIMVQASPDGGGEGPPYAVRTDADGRYVLDGLLPGSYRVDVAAPGFEPVVRRAVPAPARGLDVALRQLASVRGVVRDEHGAPAGGATVTLAGSGVWPARSTHVRDDGAFEIVGIPSGVYELRARAGESVADPLAPLLLDPGDERDVTLTVSPGATLVGTVVDALTNEPVPEARVVVAEDAVSAAPEALTADTHGVFRLTGLLRRTHQISARASGYVPRVGTVAVPGGEPVSIPLDREVIVSGRVVDANGAPVAGAQVEVMARDLDGRLSWLTSSAVTFRDALFTAQARGPRPLIPAGELGVMPGPIPRVPFAQNGGGDLFTGISATVGGFVTGADGRFRVTEVPPGVVTVAATHPAYVRGETAQRAVRAGETVEIEVVLHEGSSIDGRLVDDRGYPVPGTLIEVRSPREPAPRRVFTARDGTFRVASVLGRLSISAMVGGQVAAHVEVVLDADGIAAPVTLVIEGEGRAVHGRVVDARGFPVSGADVTVAATQGVSPAHTVSAVDGTFGATVFGRGNLQVDAHHPQYAPASVVVGNVADEVAVTLDAGGTVALTVRGDGCASGDVTVEVRTPCGPTTRVLHGGGDVRLEHVCAGRVTALATAAGCVPDTRTGTAVTGDEITLAELDLQPGGGIDGEVVDLHGDPVPGATVTLAASTPAAPAPSVRTDRRGAFTLQDLPDGDLDLVATHPVLGRSRVAPARVLRGTVARGIRLEFERDLSGATAPGGASPVQFVSREGHVEVASVAPDSAAARAGLQPGDTVVSAQGTAVQTAADAEAAVTGPAGEEVALEVDRDGVRRTVRWLREVVH